MPEVQEAFYQRDRSTFSVCFMADQINTGMLQCNKMSCPHCRTLSCYICRQIIKGYDHFDQNPPSGPSGSRRSGKCPLWDSVEQRHANEVRYFVKVLWRPMSDRFPPRSKQQPKKRWPSSRETIQKLIPLLLKWTSPMSLLLLLAPPRRLCTDLIWLITTGSTLLR
jgi:hypothetical protein